MSAATTASRSRRAGTGGWLASPPPTAAVEIAADRVTALVVADQGNGVAVSAYAAEPLKPGVVEPALNAANVHDAATLAATVGGVFDRIGTRPRRIALVIPDTAVLGGTVRTFDQETRDKLDTRIHELVTGIASSMGASADIEYRRGYPPVVNDEAMADIVREAAREVVGEDNLQMGKPKMGAEDFSYFALERPSCFFNVGTGKARSFRDLMLSAYAALGLEPNIHYIDMPEQIRGSYQYFTQSSVDRLSEVGYNGGFTALEDAVGLYVKDYLDAADHFR